MLTIGFAAETSDTTQTNADGSTAITKEIHEILDAQLNVEGWVSQWADGEKIWVSQGTKPKVSWKVTTNKFINSAATYLKPYLDSNGKVDIGELDVIYLAELTHTNPGARNYDLQNLIIHVSFAEVEKEA